MQFRCGLPCGFLGSNQCEGAAFPVRGLAAGSTILAACAACNRWRYLTPEEEEQVFTTAIMGDFE